MVKFIFALSLLFGASTWAQTAQKVKLSQKDVAEMVLKQGTKTKEVNLKYQQLRLAPAEVLTQYDWKLSLDSGFEYDKTATFNSTDTKYERFRTLLGLNKSFTSGTMVGFEFSRVSQKSDLGSFSFSNAPPSATLDKFGITLEQSLLGNFFGIADRALVRAAELNYESSFLLRADELQDAVLEGLRLFWNAYVAQENFKESMASRDRYKKLVDTVRRKAGYGYTSPGELSQVQAEFEVREQNVKKSSNDYLMYLDNLLVFLDLPEGTEIDFSVPTKLPPLPELPNIQIESLRELRSQELKVKAAEEAYAHSKAKSYPDLKFVGSIYSSGMDETSEGALSNSLSGSNPAYYAGIRLSYNFGSDYQTENMVNKRASLELEQAKLRRQKMEISDREAQAQRKVQSSFSIADSAARQKEFREKAASELQKSYTQGRTDIKALIDALNSYFTAEIQLTRALGDYQIALNEWAAIRDELIPDTKEKR